MAKVAFLRNESRPEWSTLIGLSLLERGFDVLSLSFIGLAASLALGFKECALLAMLILITALVSILVLSKTGSIPLVKNKLRPMADTMKEALKSPKDLMPAISASICCSSNNLLVMGLLLKSTDSQALVSHSFAASPIAAIAGSIPISPLGLGTRDGALAYLLRNHLPSESSLSASLLYAFATQLLLGIIGLPLLLRYRNRNISEKPHCSQPQP